MSKKIRLIARLDVKDTNLVKGIQLEGLRKLGDPNAFAKEYYEAGIDELLYIDIVASLYNRNNLSDIVRKTVDDVYIPVCVGGGLRSVEDVRHILSMGADKAAVNTAAIKRPELITMDGLVSMPVVSGDFLIIRTCVTITWAILIQLWSTSLKV